MKPAVSTSPIQLSFSCSPASQSHSYPGSHTPPGAGSSMYYTPSTGNKSGISPGSSPLYPSTVSSPGSTSFHTSMPNGSYSYRYGSNQSSPSYLSTESAVSRIFFSYISNILWDKIILVVSLMLTWLDSLNHTFIFFFQESFLFILGIIFFKQKSLKIKLISKFTIFYYLSFSVLFLIQGIS